MMIKVNNLNCGKMSIFKDIIYIFIARINKYLVIKQK